MALPSCSLSLWASEAAASSSWSEMALLEGYPPERAFGWGVSELLGSPNRLDGSCSDWPGAWSPSSNGTTEEYVRVQFASVPLRLLGINVHEVNAAPFLTRVELEGPDGQRSRIWDGVDDTPCPGWFNISYDSIEANVSAIWLFTSTPGFEEIDAVQITALGPCPPPPHPPSPPPPRPVIVFESHIFWLTATSLLLFWLLVLLIACFKCSKQRSKHSKINTLPPLPPVNESLSNHPEFVNVLPSPVPPLRTSNHLDLDNSINRHSSSVQKTESSQLTSSYVMTRTLP
eukprot:scaffold4731_cov36-Tisochrysis_lutea.AAC.2